MAGGNGDTPRELFLIDGNSLAYRAFFALPESISTSDGRPTNAIFGFASMLVKILTDYGQVPTVVVWDAGMSGRKEISADYKAQRSTRPDLLKLQWPHLRPLVEAFGYRNISVDGFEADDVIAALTEQAKERGIPVMVVSGDRDVYQLVDDGVRIMTTSRGITDTKVYDRDGVIERYGIAARADSGLHRPQGRHERQHPRRPGHRRQDRGGPPAALRRPRGRPGQRRPDLRRQAQAEPHRARRQRPHVEDARDDGPRRPDRHRPRGRVHQDAGPRQPQSRLPRLGAPRPAAGGSRRRSRPPSSRRSRAPRTSRRSTVKTGPARSPYDIARLKGEYLTLAVLPPEIPEGELLPREPKWRFAAYAGGNIALAGETDDPALVVQAAADRPVIAHDAKALTEVPPNLVFDTAVAGYLLDPGPARLPARRARRGARHRRGRRRRPGHDRRPDPRARQPPAPADRRTGPPAAPRRDRAPARPRPQRDREGRHQARHAPARDSRHPHQGRRRRARARDLGDGRRGVHHRLAAAARLHPLREAQALAQAPRQDRLQHRRPRPAGDPRRARDHPEDRALPRAFEARADLPRRAAELDRRGRPPAHDLRADDGRDRPALLHQPEPAEHPDPHRDRPRDPRLLRPRARQRAAVGRLQPGRAPRPRPHRQRAGAARHLRPRRGRAHRDRERRLRAPRREAGRRHALQGQDGQLRDRLRPLRLRPRRPPPDRPGRGAGVHRPLPRALPGRRAIHEGRRRRRPSSTATSRRSSAAAARSPSCAPATGRCASWASGWRSTP